MRGGPEVSFSTYSRPPRRNGGQGGKEGEEGVNVNITRPRKNQGPNQRDPLRTNTEALSFSRYCGGGKEEEEEKEEAAFASARSFVNGLLLLSLSLSYTRAGQGAT